MGKQVKDWIPPEDAVEVQQSDNGAPQKTWTPPDDAIEVQPVKKKDERFRRSWAAFRKEWQKYSANR
jgi:translation initiation factor IF-1